jgi:hypothetical protein
MDRRSTRHTVRKSAAIGALIGAVISCILLVLQWRLSRRVTSDSLQAYLVWQSVILVLWPSSVMLMATEGIEGTLRSNEFVLTSVVVNMLWYSVLTTCATLSIRWLKR